MKKDDIETMRILFGATIGELCNQERWNDAKEMEGIKDRLIQALKSQSENCVSKQAVLDAICKVCGVVAKPSKCQYRKGLFGGCKEYEVIKAIPSAEPKTGHWIEVYQGDEIINYRCSECELGDTNGSTNLYGWNYCRRCGAEMVEPQAESEDLA